MADDTLTTPGNGREIERALREPGIPAQCAYPGCPATTDNRLRWTYHTAGPGGLPAGLLLPAAYRRTGGDRGRGGI
jgi:hypothetical protein